MKKGAKKTTKRMNTRKLSMGIGDVLIRPRVTEKASVKGGEHIYVFEIAPRAHKGDVFNAIEKVYSVRPRKVRIARIPPKRVFVRGIRGVKSGGKKAYVHLKAGDKIEIL